MIERTPNARGKLFIVLYGYQLLVSSACPEPAVRALLESAGHPGAVPAPASAPVIPFDYVAKLPLTGRPGNTLQDEVTVNVEGGYVATALGYGLAVEEEKVPIQLQDADTALRDQSADPEVNLADLPLKALPASALHDGVRIRPEYLRIAFDASGNLRTLHASLASQALERLNIPEDVSFLYTISDTGVGRDWQNRPIHNIAGLGIANGLRPFKKFARPRFFPPRSTIRIAVEEVFGRGVLFLVFQGYKILGAPFPGGRS